MENGLLMDQLSDHNHLLRFRFRWFRFQFTFASVRDIFFELLNGKKIKNESALVLQLYKKHICKITITKDNFWHRKNMTPAMSQ